MSQARPTLWAAGLAALGLAVLGVVVWWWSTASTGPAADRAVDGETDGVVEPSRADPSAVDPGLLERLRGRLQATQDAESWLVEGGHAHAFVCEGLDPQTAALASELLPPRPADGGQRIVRRYASGWEVLTLGAGQSGMLTWGEDGCRFERLDPYELSGEVAFDDGELAAGAVVEACGITTRTDEQGRFDLSVSPDRSAVYSEGRLDCPVRVVHPDGFTADVQVWPDGVADVVLDVPTSAVEVELLEARLSTRGAGSSAWRQEQGLWLEDVVSLGAPPPAVRSLLEDRLQTIQSAESRAEANELLEDVGLTPEEIGELFPDG